MKKQTPFVLMLLLMSSLGFSQTSLTVEDAVAYALQNNAEVKNAALSVDGAQQEVKSIVATGLPQLTANGNFTHNVQIAAMQLPDFVSPAVYGVLITEGLLTPDKFQAGQPQTVAFGAPSSITGMANLSQLVFDGTYFLGLKAARQYVDMARLQNKSTEINTTVTVQKLFYGVLSMQNNVAALKANVEHVTELYEQMNQLYGEGFSEKLDVDRMAYAKSNMETQLKNMEVQHANMLTMFKAIIGYDINADIILVGELMPAGSTSSENGSSTRIEMQILQQKMLLDSLNIKRYKVGYMPSLRLNASYQQNTFANEAEFKGLGNQWNPGMSYSFNLSIPIFDGFYKQAKISQAKIEHEKDKNLIRFTQNQLNAQLQQAERNMAIKTKMVENQEKNKALANNIYEATKAKYDEGMASSIDLINAKSDKVQAEMAYNNAVYELKIAEIDMNQASGAYNN